MIDEKLLKSVIAGELSIATLVTQIEELNTDVATVVKLAYGMGHSDAKRSCATITGSRFCENVRNKCKL